MDKIIEMKSTFYYYLSAFFLIIWAIGYVIFNVDGLFHLIFLAGVAILLVKIVFDFNKME